jgi:hypothetical protein
MSSRTARSRHARKHLASARLFSESLSAELPSATPAVQAPVAPPISDIMLIESRLFERAHERAYRNLAISFYRDATYAGHVLKDGDLVPTPHAAGYGTIDAPLVRGDATSRSMEILVRTTGRDAVTHNQKINMLDFVRAHTVASIGSALGYAVSHTPAGQPVPTPPTIAFKEGIWRAALHMNLDWACPVSHYLTFERGVALNSTLVETFVFENGHGHALAAIVSLYAILAPTIERQVLPTVPAAPSGPAATCVPHDQMLLGSPFRARSRLLPVPFPDLRVEGIRAEHPTVVSLSGASAVASVFSPVESYYAIGYTPVEIPNGREFATRAFWEAYHASEYSASLPDFAYPRLGYARIANVMCVDSVHYNDGLQPARSIYSLAGGRPYRLVLEPTTPTCALEAVRSVLYLHGATVDAHAPLAIANGEPVGDRVTTYIHEYARDLVHSHVRSTTPADSAGAAWIHAAGIRPWDLTDAFAHIQRGRVCIAPQATDGTNVYCWPARPELPVGFYWRSSVLAALFYANISVPATLDTLLAVHLIHVYCAQQLIDPLRLEKCTLESWFAQAARLVASSAHVERQVSAFRHCDTHYSPVVDFGRFFFPHLYEEQDRIETALNAIGCTNDGWSIFDFDLAIYFLDLLLLLCRVHVVLYHNWEDLGTHTPEVFEILDEVVVPVGLSMLACRFLVAVGSYTFDPWFQYIYINGVKSEVPWPKRLGELVQRQVSPAFGSNLPVAPVFGFSALFTVVIIAALHIAYALLLESQGISPTHWVFYVIGASHTTDFRSLAMFWLIIALCLYAVMFVVVLSVFAYVIRATGRTPVPRGTASAHTVSTILLKVFNVALSALLWWATYTTHALRESPGVAGDFFSRLFHVCLMFAVVVSCNTFAAPLLRAMRRTEYVFELTAVTVFASAIGAFAFANFLLPAFLMRPIVVSREGKAKARLFVKRALDRIGKARLSVANFHQSAGAAFVAEEGYDEEEPGQPTARDDDTDDASLDNEVDELAEQIIEEEKLAGDFSGPMSYFHALRSASAKVAQKHMGAKVPRKKAVRRNVRAYARLVARDAHVASIFLREALASSLVAPTDVSLNALVEEDAVRYQMAVHIVASLMTAGTSRVYDSKFYDWEFFPGSATICPVPAYAPDASDVPDFLAELALMQAVSLEPDLDLVTALRNRLGYYSKQYDLAVRARRAHAAAAPVRETQNMANLPMPIDCSVAVTAAFTSAHFNTAGSGMSVAGVVYAPQPTESGLVPIKALRLCRHALTDHKQYTVHMSSALIMSELTALSIKGKEGDTSGLPTLAGIKSKWFSVAGDPHGIYVPFAGKGTAMHLATAPVAKCGWAVCRVSPTQLAPGMIDSTDVPEGMVAANYSSVSGDSGSPVLHQVTHYSKRCGVAVGAWVVAGFHEGCVASRNCFIPVHHAIREAAVPRAVRDPKTSVAVTDGTLPATHVFVRPASDAATIRAATSRFQRKLNWKPSSDYLDTFDGVLAGYYKKHYAADLARYQAYRDYRALDDATRQLTVPVHKAHVRWFDILQDALLAFNQDASTGVARRDDNISGAIPVPIKDFAVLAAPDGKTRRVEPTALFVVSQFYDKYYDRIFALDEPTDHLTGLCKGAPGWPDVLSVSMKADNYNEKKMGLNRDTPDSSEMRTLQMTPFLFILTERLFASGLADYVYHMPSVRNIVNLTTPFGVAAMLPSAFIDDIKIADATGDFVGCASTDYSRFDGSCDREEWRHFYSVLPVPEKLKQFLSYVVGAAPFADTNGEVFVREPIGNPSGCFFTAAFNSARNVSIVTHFKKQRRMSLAREDFVVCGDDLMWTLPPGQDARPFALDFCDWVSSNFPIETTLDNVVHATRENFRLTSTFLCNQYVNFGGAFHAFVTKPQRRFGTANANATPEQWFGLAQSLASTLWLHQQHAVRRVMNSSDADEHLSEVLTKFEQAATDHGVDIPAIVRGYLSVKLENRSSGAKEPDTDNQRLLSLLSKLKDQPSLTPAANHEQQPHTQTASAPVKRQVLAMAKANNGRKRTQSVAAARGASAGRAIAAVVRAREQQSRTDRRQAAVAKVASTPIAVRNARPPAPRRAARIVAVPRNVMRTTRGNSSLDLLVRRFGVSNILHAISKKAPGRGRKALPPISQRDMHLKTACADLSVGGTITVPGSSTLVIAPTPYSAHPLAFLSGTSGFPVTYQGVCGGNTAASQLNGGAYPLGSGSVPGPMTIGWVPFMGGASASPITTVNPANVMYGSDYNANLQQFREGHVQLKVACPVGSTCQVWSLGATTDPRILGSATVHSAQVRNTTDGWLEGSDFYPVYDDNDTWKDWYAKFAAGTLTAAWGDVITGSKAADTLVGGSSAAEKCFCMDVIQNRDGFQCLGNQTPGNVPSDLCFADGRIMSGVLQGQGLYYITVPAGSTAVVTFNAKYSYHVVVEDRSNLLNSGLVRTVVHHESASQMRTGGGVGSAPTPYGAAKAASDSGTKELPQAVESYAQHVANQVASAVDSANYNSTPKIIPPVEHNAVMGVVIPDRTDPDSNAPTLVRMIKDIWPHVRDAASWALSPDGMATIGHGIHMAREIATLVE